MINHDIQIICPSKFISVQILRWTKLPSRLVRLQQGFKVIFTAIVAGKAMVIGMKIAVHANLTREFAHEVTCNVIKELNKLNAEVLMNREFELVFSDMEVTFADDYDAIEFCDVFIVIGGDGTFIHAAQKAAKFDKEILGINAGNLGFLAGLEKQELHLLKKLIDGDYTIDQRMMICAEHYIDGELKNKYYCLNDAVIARGNSMRMCDISVSCDGKFVNDYYADGLIFATPTGSTAYSLSSGGPVVDPTLECLILTPICTHSLFARSLMFGPDSKLEIKIKNPELCIPLISCDGKDPIDVEPGSSFIIRKAGRRSKIIRIKAESFTDVLSKKMIERRV